MSRFAALLVALLLAGNSFACINDRELPNHEREFRSQYQEVEYQPPVEPEQVADSRLPMFLVGVAGASGFLMALVGGLLVLRSRQASA